jgi:predicted dehydrogenase
VTRELKENGLLRVAMVGAGNIAKQHLRVWQRIKGVQLSAVCDVNADAAGKMAAAANAKAFNDFDVLIRETDADIIDICTPPSSHVPLALAAMDSGRHVLLEKPMAMNSAGAAELVAKQRESGVQLGVMHNWLFHPVVWRARTLVDRGAIGDVLSVNIQMVDSKDDEMIADPKHWCHALPGGRFGECLIHPVYLVQAFTGANRVESLVAAKRGDYDWVRADEVHATLVGERGTGTIYASFNAPRGMVVIELFGTKGILRLDMISHTIVIQREETRGHYRKIAVNLQEAAQMVESTLRSAVLHATHKAQPGHERYMNQFVAALNGQGRMPVTADEALSAVRTMEELCLRLGTEDLQPMAAK